MFDVNRLTSISIIFIILSIIYAIPLAYVLIKWIYKKYFSSKRCHSDESYQTYANPSNRHTKEPFPDPTPEELNNIIIHSINRFYWKKNSCMTPNESLMFFYLNCALDELLPSKIRKYYYIFPQISLYSFISIPQQSLSKAEHSAALRSLLSKNFDFIICHCIWKQQGTKKPDDQASFFYAYTPIIAIELDGSSHFDATKYGEENFARQKRNDEFKNALTAQLDLPLIRYTLNNDKVTQQDRANIKEILSKHLSSVENSRHYSQ